ncbi:MAG: RNA 2',3'-cyclic phosphodiesterase, partial [Planctomycetota bacterium]
MRCFTAIELDATWRRALGNWIAEQRAADTRDVRWCTPEQLHITLTFLGQVEPNRIPAICDALAPV